MAEFWTVYLWPLIVIVAQSLLLLVLLLVSIAYVLLADRKIWAAVQIRRGPNVVGPWGLLQSFADLLKFVFKEPVIPAGSNKGVFLLAPLVTCTLALAGWAVIPVNPRLGDRRHQCRHALHFRDLLADGLRRHHGGLGVELEIRFPRRDPLGGADGVLRGLDRLRHHHRAALRRLVEALGDRRGAGHPLRHVRLVLAAAVADVRHVLRLGAGRDQPPAVRSGRGGVRAGRGLHGRIRLVALHDVHARRIRGDRHHVRDGARSCSSAAGCRRSRSCPSPGCRA